MKRIRELLAPLTKEELMSLLLVAGIIITGIAVKLFRG
jgi:hypothetical protein